MDEEQYKRIDSAADISLLTLEDERALIAHAKNDEKFMTILIAKMSKILRLISKNYFKNGIDIRDLMQQGVVGIMKAVAGYDEKAGFRFSTYARWWILSGMQEFYLGNSRAFSVPLAISQHLNRLLSKTEELASEAITVDVAAECGMTPRKHKEVMRCVYHPEEIDYSDTNRSYADNEHSDPYESCAKQDSIKRLGYAMNALPDIQRRILTYRFGLNGCEEKTLQETGKYVGLSHERVRQLEIAAMKRLHRIVS